MRLSDMSIRNPVFAWMLMAALIIFGGIGFSRMGVSQLPDVDFPVLNVSMTLQGAAPEVMETSVVDPTEDVLMSVEGVRSISSTSKTGVANITVEFELGRDIDVALQEVQSKVAQVQKKLPKNVDPATISKTNPDDQPIIWLALTSEKNDPLYLMKYARDFLKDRFTTVSGVGDINLGGYTDPQLRVWVKGNKLVRNNITVTDIVDAIQGGHSELPGGFVEEGKKNYNVRTMGEAQTVQEFNQIVISKRAGQVIQDPAQALRIGDVARVEEGLDEVIRVSRFNGIPALGLGIKKQRGSNAVAVAQAVKDKVKELAPQLPKGMKLSINFDSTRFIEDSVHELNKHLILAVILTSLVCWIFLGSWSATFNVLLSIPTSIMGAFIGLYFFGFTLNTFTLLGLTLAIGIVVDDAIMVLENIFRYNEQGKGHIESAIVGAREITFAALAASIAVIAIFLPVAFMKGIIGKFFLQFGVTISLAVILSLMESLTITPMRCANFVHSGERTSRVGRAFEDFMTWLKVKYEQTLQWTLKHRAFIVVVSIVFTAGSFFCIKFLKTEFIPPQDQSLFVTRIRLPVGSSMTYTNQQILKAESWMRSRSEVLQVYASVGGGGSSDVNTAMMFVTMHDKGERGIDKEAGHELSQMEFMAVARKHLAEIPDLRPIMMDLSQRGFSTGKGYPIEFTVTGPDWEKLAVYSDQIMKDMTSSGLMTDVDSDYLIGMPEIQLKPDRVQAGLHGISVLDIGNTVNALIGGVLVNQYPKDGRRYDIQVRMEKDGDPFRQIKTLYIGNSKNNLIPLSRVVTQQVKPSLQSINRVNRQRAVTVTANLKPKVSQTQAIDFIEKDARKILADGYAVNQTGSSKSFQETFESLIFALILGLVIAYMVLASQFNSFLDPVTILMALPFSFSGAFFALLVSGESLNIYSMIGLLLLMGIVKKNSILLIEFTNTVRDRKSSGADEALIEACPIRLRPILMTSIATVASAIPSALAFGAGGETSRPMAITLIGGVLVSTALTLYVVPCAYSLLDRFRRRDEVREKTRQAFANVGDEALG